MKPIRRPTRTDVLYSALRDLAIKLGPEARLPTVDQLCGQLDVAKVTLDSALRRLEAERILVRLPRRGIYVSSTIAQKTIAVVFGGDIFSAPFSPFWSLMLQAVRKQAAERKHRALAYLDIAQAGGGLGGHEQLFEDLEGRRLHGILLLAPSHKTEEMELIRRHNVPVVVFGLCATGWAVGHDMATMLRLAARELVARGCRRVALMGQTDEGQMECLGSELRDAGYEGEPVADWTYETWASRLPGPFDREMFGHRLAVRKLADRIGQPLPDGVVSMDDTTTRGAITAFRQEGLITGRDLQIATIANKGSSVLEPCAAGLIQIEFDAAASVGAAMEMLETLMKGGTPPRNLILVAPVLRA